jgi:hypothetical protein
MNTTPDGDGKSLLVALFDPCVQVIFGPNVIDITADNTLSMNVQCIIYVAHNTLELTLYRALNEPLTTPVTWGSSLGPVPEP